MIADINWPALWAAFGFWLVLVVIGFYLGGAFPVAAARFHAVVIRVFAGTGVAARWLEARADALRKHAADIKK